VATRYDAIVIGAGHNGLTTACLLARAGRRVLVIEKRGIVGGLCAPEEFHPGYHAPGILHDTAQLRTELLEDLHLDEHGLDLMPPEPTLFASPNDGTGVLINLSDPAATAAEITRVSPNDANRWGQYRAFVSRARDLIEPLLNEAPPELARLGSFGPGGLGGLPLSTAARLAKAARRFGRRDLAGLLRIPPMCVADWLNEWFESDIVKGGLAHAAIQATWAGPWSPGTAANLLLLECTMRHSVVGGAAGVAAALQRASRRYGVEIRTEAEVTRIRLDGGAVAGVTLKSGEEIDARVVVSGLDPRTTFLRLIEPGTLPLAFEHRVGVLRARGTSAKVHLALDRRLEFAAKPGERVARARTTHTLDDLERAFDPVKYRGASARPLLDVFIPSVARPETAPDGCDVVSLLVHFAPFDLAGGWTPAARERLGDAAVAELERVAPHTSKAVVAREVLTPADLAERFGLDGGHIHHLEPALDQLVIRPTMDTMRFATPVGGLFLCGAGSHPGGGVTCAPGALAADAIVAAG
jgi:phytoene dehydrogenase-like protein